MKKIILSVVLLLAVTTSSIYAAEIPEPNEDPEEIFKKSFPAAECVKWDRQGDYRKVSFVLYGRGAQAFFSPEGDLLGTIRNVLYTDLPIKVMMAIKKRFNNALPYALTEIDRVDGTFYKFSVEMKNRRYDATLSLDGSFSKVVQR